MIYVKGVIYVKGDNFCDIFIVQTLQIINVKSYVIASHKP